MWVVETRLWARQSGSNLLQVQNIFHFYKTFRLVQGPTHPHIQQVPGVLCLMEKWLQHNKSDHSPSSGATINNKSSKALPPCMCHRHSVGSQKFTVFIERKVTLLQDRLWTRGWRDVELYSSMTSALGAGEWSTACPGCTLPPGKT